MRNVVLRHTCKVATCCRSGLVITVHSPSTQSTAASFTCRGPSKGSDDGEMNTFPLCCALYWHQEYPSFYCTLIYYSETGERASTASVFSKVYSLSNLLDCHQAVISSKCKKHTPPTSSSVVILRIVFLFTSVHTSVRVVSCR